MTKTSSRVNAKQKSAVAKRNRMMTGPQSKDPAAQGGWHLDKRVPVAIIFTLILQTFGIIWWAATTQAQTNANTQAINTLNNIVASNESRSQPLRDTVVETATQVKMMSQTMERQNTMLDRLSSQIAQIPGVKP